MTSSAIYGDDEPVAWQPANAPGNGVLELTMHCEYPAVPHEAEQKGFAVMLHVRAPALSAVEAKRTALDLVVVLDVSESMAGDKLAQVKRAMGFVVDSLGPRDRLCVVAFSGAGRRVTRLARMTEGGKAAARRAVEALVAAGPTNLRAGLDGAAEVLRGSRHKNDAAGVIFVSDGHDSCSTHRYFRRTSPESTTSDSCVLVPQFFLPYNRSWRRTPVHTFGLGSGVDAAAMHNISEVTGGTFSFVEDLAAIQDAVAQCVGGLRSVTAQGVCVKVDDLSDDVCVTAVKSGRYESGVKEESYERYKGTAYLGELYADEERRVLFFLDVDVAEAGTSRISLLEARCSYMDMSTVQTLDVKSAGEAHVRVLEPDDTTEVAPSVEVERELLRAEAAEDMALAREAAERGAHGEAARILDARRESLSRSAPALSGDAMITALVAELHELSVRVADAREYKATGRACILAGMSAHAQQRGSSVRLSRPMAGALFGGVGSSSVFATPEMRRMEKLSQMLRKQQEASSPPPPPLPENGSKSTVPRRSRLEARLASAVPRLSMLNRYRRLLLRR